MFFIGDGLTGTGTGTTQVFNVPSTATHLYLGYVDSCDNTGPGCYYDNSGSMTATFVITPSASRIALTGITGWTLGDLVVDAQWTGQPTTDNKPGTNIYDLFYAIDACQQSTPCLASCETESDGCFVGGSGQPVVAVNPVWHLNGSGFCPATGCAGKKGSVAFSDPAINTVLASNITNWNSAGTEITFAPSFSPASFSVHRKSKRFSNHNDTRRPHCDLALANSRRQPRDAGRHRNYLWTRIWPVHVVCCQSAARPRASDAC